MTSTPHERTPEVPHDESPAPSPEWTDLRVCAQAGPEGERVAVRSHPTATATVTWHETGTVTDLCEPLPDLLMLGWIDSSHQAGDDTLDVESVEVGTVHLAGIWEVYVSNADGEIYQVSAEVVAGWTQIAIKSLITTGVAHEVLYPSGHDEAPQTTTESSDARYDQ